MRILTSVVLFSMLSLPSTVSFTTISHVVRHVGSITKKSTTVTTAYHILVEENSNEGDTSYLSVTFPVFLSMLSLPSTVSSTSNSPLLNVFRHGERIDNFWSTMTTRAYHILLEENYNRSDTS